MDHQVTNLNHLDPLSSPIMVAKIIETEVVTRESSHKAVVRSEIKMK